MTPAMVRTDPPGIVVQDGELAHETPRITMWYWGTEDDVPDWDRDE